MNDEPKVEKVSLNDWVYLEGKAIGRFVKAWREMQKRAPDQYPEIMPIGEWDEQFRAFNE